VTAPVLTFFSNKGGIGKTSLVFHLAWMLSRIGERVLACDLDPQANLTATFLTERELESLWENNANDRTIYQCVQPLMEVGDLREPHIHEVSEALGLIPGDLALSGFEDSLSSVWPEALSEANLYRPFRILSAFWQIMQAGAAQMNATIILVDVGPNLGALNRSALIAASHVIAPLGAGLFSLQALQNLGPTLSRWAREWAKRRERWKECGQAPAFPLPDGAMEPIGYIVQQHGVRLGRPVKAYDRWVNRMPAAYRLYLLNQVAGRLPARPQDDPYCLATVKHYRSLVPMAQEARKPVFDLTAADGAIGAHAAAVSSAHAEFRELAIRIRKGTGISVHPIKI